MHYNTISLVIFALFAAGTVSASGCVTSGGLCGDTFGPCCDGIVYVSVSVVSILMLLYHCQDLAARTAMVRTPPIVRIRLSGKKVFFARRSPVRPINHG